eukprot:g481.t1
MICLECFRRQNGAIERGREDARCKVDCGRNSDVSKMGFHTMIGRWSVPSLSAPASLGLSSIIAIEPLIRFIERSRRKEKVLELKDICVKVGVRSLKRLYRANLRYPCIVAVDTVNPAKRKYRMIDGKHRVHRAVLAGETTMRCWVVKEEELQPYVMLLSSTALLPHDAGTAADSGSRNIKAWLDAHVRKDAEG